VAVPRPGSERPKDKTIHETDATKLRPLILALAVILARTAAILAAGLLD